MSSLPSRETFQSSYAGKAPWDIPKPQKIFADAADRILGDVLDSGCGTGENALHFAKLGRNVTGIDFVEEAIRRARRKVIERGVWATFLVKDALTLSRWDQRFDSVIDCGLFHVFADDARKRYVEGLATVVKPGGRVFVACFSDQEPGTQGPRRISQQELHDAFRQGWEIESIQPVRFETRTDLTDIHFSEGGPKAWFMIARRPANPNRIEAVIETVVYGDDLAALEAFYTSVLGLPVIEREAGRHVFFRVGSGDVFLVFKADSTLHGDTLPPHGAKGPSHFAMGIESTAYDSWRRHLLERGVAIEREVSWPLGGKSIYFRDPAGNLAELITPGVWGTPNGW